MAERPSSNVSGNFWRIAESGDISDMPEAARAVASWSSQAPNPLIIVGSNGSGKTTLLSKIADYSHRAAPDKKVMWLGGSMAGPLENQQIIRREPSSYYTELLHFSNRKKEFIDLLLVDDMLGVYSNEMRDDILDAVLNLVKLKTRLVIAVSDPLILTSKDRRLSILEASGAALIELDQFPRRLRSERSIVSQLQSLDISDLPQQSNAAPKFDINRDGPIAIAREPAPLETTEKIELYEELRLKALDFLDSCPRESNRTARLRESVENLLELLPPDLVNVQPRRLWSRANNLRRRRDADLRLRRSTDPEQPPLPELAAELLSDLVEQFNVFAFCDEVLRELDSSSLGPRDRAEVLVELEAGRDLSRALAKAPHLVEASAVAVLEEAADQATEAADQAGVNAEQALSQALATQRNGAIAVLTKAIKEVKQRLKSVEDGVWKYAGAEIAKSVYAHFVRIYDAQLSSLLGRIHGAEIVAYVLRLFRQLTGL